MGKKMQDPDEYAKRAQELEANAKAQMAAAEALAAEARRIQEEEADKNKED